MTPLVKSLSAVAAAALLAGCGGGGGGDNGIEKLSGAKALAKVKADVADVQWVHAKGQINQGDKTLQLDVHAGHDVGEGTLVVGGGQLELRLVDGVAYIRADKDAMAALGASPAEAGLAAGKWLKSPESQGAFASFAGFLEADKLFGSLLTPSGTVSTGRTTTVNGTKALALVDSTNDAGTLYVSETGKALPLRIVKTGSGGGRVDFTDYGDPVDVSAPAGAVDVSQLGQ